MFMNRVGWKFGLCRTGRRRIWFIRYPMGAFFVLASFWFLGTEPVLGEEASLLISWDANTEQDLAGYYVYIGTESCNYDSSIDVGNVTEHRVFGLAPGQEYFFVVTALDQAGNESAPSEEVSAVAREPMTVAQRQGVDVQLNWSPVQQAESYNVYWSADPYFTPSAPIANVSVNSFSDVGRLADSLQNNYYEVRAVQGGQEVYSYNRAGLFNVHLRSGRNLVSLPLIPAEMTLDEILGNQLTGAMSANQSDQVLQWNGSGYTVAWLVEGTQSPYEGKWVTEAGDTLSNIRIDPNAGFWIVIREGHVDTTVDLAGSVSIDTVRTIQFTEGFNLIGSCYPVGVSLQNSELYLDGAATGGTNAASADQLLYWNGQGYEIAWLVDGTGTSWDGVWVKETELDTTDIDLTPACGYWIKIRNGHTPQPWTFPSPDH